MKSFKKLKFILVLLSCFSVSAFGKGKLPVYPAEFLYDNQPIEPACFYQMVGEQSIKDIDLSTHDCQNTTTEFDVKQIPYGLLGYHLVDQTPSMSLPYIYYRLIGQKEPKSFQEYYVELQWSGGGSGNFKELILVQKKQNKLKLVENIASGDRCFGGVTHASYSNQELRYSQNMTAADLGRLLKFSESEVEKLGLTDCAVCCIGLLHHRDDKISGITLNSFDHEDLKNLTGECFSRTLMPYLGTHQKELSQEASKNLANQLRKTCLIN